MKAILPTDEELLDRSRKGDNAAFRQLVQRHEQQVRATVIGMLGDTAEADDVAQETFIRLFNALHQFRGDAQLNTYLTRIAINLSLNALKKRQRNQKRFLLFQRDDDSVKQMEDTAMNPERQDTKELVQRALQQLEPEFRSVVVLRLLDGFSVKETAEILNVPQGTVASRLARGQLKLKEIMESWNVF